MKLFEHENPGDGPGQEPWKDREVLTIYTTDEDRKLEIVLFNGLETDMEDSLCAYCTLTREAALTLHDALTRVLY